MNFCVKFFVINTNSIHLRFLRVHPLSTRSKTELYQAETFFCILCRARLKISSCLWEAGIPLLVCSAYGMVGMMRLAVQEHTGKRMAC